MIAEEFDDQRIKKCSARCRIIGPDLKREYFSQDMSIAWHEGIVYLRIGDDVYHGQKVKQSTEGTNIHFHVDMSDLNRNRENMDQPAANFLSDFSVTDSEVVFWPAGTMRKSEDDEMTLRQSETQPEDPEFEARLQQVQQILGIEEPETS